MYTHPKLAARITTYLRNHDGATRLAIYQHIHKSQPRIRTTLQQLVTHGALRSAADTRDALSDRYWLTTYGAEQFPPHSDPKSQTRDTTKAETLEAQPLVQTEDDLPSAIRRQLETLAGHPAVQAHARRAAGEPRPKSPLPTPSLDELRALVDQWRAYAGWTALDPSARATWGSAAEQLEECLPSVPAHVHARGGYAAAGQALAGQAYVGDLYDGDSDLAVRTRRRVEAEEGFTVELPGGVTLRAGESVQIVGPRYAIDADPASWSDASQLSEAEQLDVDMRARLRGWGTNPDEPDLVGPMHAVMFIDGERLVLCRTRAWGSTPPATSVAADVTCDECRLVLEGSAHPDRIMAAGRLLAGTLEPDAATTLAMRRIQESSGTRRLVITKPHTTRPVVIDPVAGVFISSPDGYLHMPADGAENHTDKPGDPCRLHPLVLALSAVLVYTEGLPDVDGAVRIVRWLRDQSTSIDELLADRSLEVGDQQPSAEV